MKGLVLGALIAIVIAACVNREAPSKPPNGERYALLTQQTALWTQIRDWRREAGMRVDPSPQSMLELRGRSIKEAQRVCPDTHPITTKCEDICSLADAICDNAEAICDIADKLDHLQKP